MVPGQVAKPRLLYPFQSRVIIAERLAIFSDLHHIWLRYLLLEKLVRGTLGSFSQ